MKRLFSRREIRVYQLIAKQLQQQQEALEQLLLEIRAWAFDCGFQGIWPACEHMTHTLQVKYRF